MIFSVHFFLYMFFRIVLFWRPSVRVGDIRKQSRDADPFVEQTKVEVLAIQDNFTKVCLLFPDGRKSHYWSSPTWVIFNSVNYLLERGNQQDESKYQVRETEVS